MRLSDWRWLYLTHRWVGVACCLLFVMWLGSGIVMMYVPYPSRMTTARLAGLSPITWDQIRISPTQAMAAAGQTDFPRNLTLEMLAGEPVWRITGDDDASQQISAVTGRAIAAISPAQALRVAALLFPGRAIGAPRLIFRDQWTVSGSYNKLRPFAVMPVGDGTGRRVYVSLRSGEAILSLTRAERVWNWVGSIPHWIYPAILRSHPALWRQIILWLSFLGIVEVAIGLWIGIPRLRLHRGYKGRRISPYRGWMRWHHLSGVIGGLCLLTWISSGWLSLQPNDWFTSDGISPRDLRAYTGHDEADFPWDGGIKTANIVLLSLRWIGGQPVIDLTDPQSHRQLPRSPSQAQIFQAARNLRPGVSPARQEVLTREDFFWYAHDTPIVLPVLRIIFPDNDGSWFYIDPTNGALLDMSDHAARGYRYAFYALHDLDFGALIHHRPLWDVVMLLLLGSGLVVAISGSVIGWRRLRR